MLTDSASMRMTGEPILLIAICRVRVSGGSSPPFSPAPGRLLLTSRRSRHPAESTELLSAPIPLQLLDHLRPPCLRAALFAELCALRSRPLELFPDGPTALCSPWKPKGQPGRWQSPTGEGPPGSH